MTLSRKWDFGLFAYNFDKWEVWTCPLMRNMICEFIWFRIRLNESIGMSLSRKRNLAYMVTILINMKVELVPWFKTWYLNLFGFKFGKMKVLDWPLSRKWDFGLYAYKFDKWDVWTCPLMRNMICEPIRVFRKMEVLEWLCLESIWFRIP